MDELTEDYSLEDTLSDSSEEQLQRGKEGAKGCQNFCWGEKNSQPSKITANNKKQTSQVNGFSAFLCMGRCKSLGT